jgi:hypothetical protein
MVKSLVPRLLGPFRQLTSTVPKHDLPIGSGIRRLSKTIASDTFTLSSKELLAPKYERRPFTGAIECVAGAFNGEIAADEPSIKHKITLKVHNPSC